MRSAPFRRRGRPPRSFTLTELLVVIAIIGVLSALTLPSLRGLSGANNLTAGGNLVTDLLDRARMNAMTKEMPTAVVAVTQFGADTNSNYRTIACFELNVASNAWSQITRWRRLPNTVLFDPAETTAGTASFFQTPTNSSFSPALTSLVLDGQPIGGFSYQAFLPSGQLYGQSTPVELRLFDIHPSGGQTNSYTIVINQDTGRIKIERP